MLLQAIHDLSFKLASSFCMLKNSSKASAITATGSSSTVNSVLSTKIIKEIEADVRDNLGAAFASFDTLRLQPVSHGHNDSGGSNGDDNTDSNAAAVAVLDYTQTAYHISHDLLQLINKYHVQTFDGDEMEIEDIIHEVIKVHSLIQGIFLFHLDHVFDRYYLWRKHLPDIVPHYAVKSCPDVVLLSCLHHLGVKFDVASSGEISLLKKLDIPGKKMLYANPVKLEEFITHAKLSNIRYFTFDNADELTKFRKVYKKAKLILRICVDDEGSLMKFSNKFGCPPENYDKIFRLAREEQLKIVGVSFHVGSVCLQPSAFSAAIREARRVFNLAATYGYQLTILDIGGGFPGDPKLDPHFINIADSIKSSLDLYFRGKSSSVTADDSNNADNGSNSDNGSSGSKEDEVDCSTAIPNLQVWAEPGRFFSASCATLIFSIIGRNERRSKSGHWINYTANTSIYSSASNVQFDHANLQIEVLGHNSAGSESDEADSDDDGDAGSNTTYPGTMFGHSCDGADILCSTNFPEMECGDICFIRHMGAYTMASSSKFNGFNPPIRVYTYCH